MREILFRGKRTDCWEWVEGYLNQHRGRVIFDCCCNAINANDYYINDWTEKLDTDLYGCVYKVDPETVGQYTGLTDKNGVKIFEGDIVRYGTNTNRADNKEIHEVVFETRGGSGYFGIRISEIETWNFCLEVPAKLMEVIGNIHDNPEILKVGDNNE